MVENPGCDTEEDKDAWSYCTPDNVATTTPSPATTTPTAEPCRCASLWSSPEDKCFDIKGCPATPCDDDELGSWCMVENPGCDTEEDKDAWSYCTPDNVATTTPSPATTTPCPTTTTPCPTTAANPCDTTSTTPCPHDQHD